MMTPKQEAFCLAYIETGNASEAYRRTYSIDKMKPETVNRKAKALLDNGKIAARIAELRAPVVKTAQLTLGSHLAELEKLRDLAAKGGKFSAAVQAEIARGRAAGLYIERAEITGKDGRPNVEENKQSVAQEMVDSIREQIRANLDFTEIQKRREKLRADGLIGPTNDDSPPLSLSDRILMHLKAQEDDQFGAQTGSA